MTYTSTYDPADNKLRLYSLGRLPEDTYREAHNLGFRWAPKQELFFAPGWSPAREDFLLDLCGEIGDEDTSLVERAEARAERFEGYSERRADDADRAHTAVAAIADNIPFGQPILVGHHSERRARKDAERIENGMRRAINLWDTAKYWESRAKGALAHAKYKERPDVRARRIKTLEAERRKCERSRAESSKWLRLWSEEGLTHERAVAIANVCWLHLPRKEGDKPDFNGLPTAYDALTNSHPTLYAPRTLDEIVAHAKRVYPRSIAHSDRWIAHLDNRILYERAMLGEAGGLAAEKFDLQPGGQVLVGQTWATIVRVNRSLGRVSSVSTNAQRWPNKPSVEQIKDYRPPTEELAAKVKVATKLAPLCNYPGESFHRITKAEWERRWTSGKGTETVEATETAGKHRVRYFFGVGGSWKSTHVFITDAPVKHPPKAEPAQAAELVVTLATLPRESDPAETLKALEARAAYVRDSQAESEGEQKFERLREVARAGVEVVSAPQLFATPPEIAAQVVEVADIEPEHRVLEPSAGTGNLIAALLAAIPHAMYTAAEVNYKLVAHIRERYDNGRAAILEGDFLCFEPEALGLFDRVIMNPPFVNATDIKHILHARKFLAPGGLLVALCANGPRQREQLKPLASHWEDLPTGSFAESGTNVNVALLVMGAEGEACQS